MINKKKLIEYALLDELIFNKTNEYLDLCSKKQPNLIYAVTYFIDFDIEHEQVYIRYYNNCNEDVGTIKVSFDEFIKFCNGNK